MLQPQESLELLRGARDPEDARSALQALAVLLELIDNANNLHVLGGIDPVVQALGSEHTGACPHVCRRHMAHDM